MYRIFSIYVRLEINIFGIHGKFWESYNTSLGTFPAGELESDDTGKLLCDVSQRNYQICNFSNDQANRQYFFFHTKLNQIFPQYSDTHEILIFSTTRCLIHFWLYLNFAFNFRFDLPILFLCEKSSTLPTLLHFQTSSKIFTFSPTALKATLEYCRRVFNFAPTKLKVTLKYCRGVFSFSQTKLKLTLEYCKRILKHTHVK